MFEESIGALSQCPIVDVATTAESTGKNVYLPISWIEPVLVCSLLFHTLPDSTYRVESQVSCACALAAFQLTQLEPMLAGLPHGVGGFCDARIISIAR